MFFYKGLKNTKTGDKQLVIAFRDLVYTHDNLEAKKRKEIRLESAIDYYENKDGKLSFILTDKNSKIINEKFDQKQLSKYSYDFFKKSLNKIIETLTVNPAKILQINKGTLKEGSNGDICVLDLDAPWVVEAEKLKSKNFYFLVSKIYI